MLSALNNTSQMTLLLIDLSSTKLLILILEYIDINYIYYFIFYELNSVDHTDYK